MSARDDYPNLAAIAAWGVHPSDQTEAIRALDEIDRLRDELESLVYELREGYNRQEWTR